MKGDAKSHYIGPLRKGAVRGSTGRKPKNHIRSPLSGNYIADQHDRSLTNGAWATQSGAAAASPGSGGGAWSAQRRAFSVLFPGGRHQAAFTALVQRHGPMVLSV